MEDAMNELSMIFGGDLMTEKFNVKGVNVDKEGRFNETDPLWTQELSWSLRFFDEDKWKRDLEKAGLEAERVEDGGFQKWYILKAKPLLGV